MITVAEAERMILNNCIKANTEKVSLVQSLGKILAKDLYASRGYPSFDRVMMDGVALNSRYSSKTYRRIEGCQSAGQEQQRLQEPDNCIEVMTGAPLPMGCDCVIPYERTEIADGFAQILSPEEPYQFIHKKDTDYKKDDLLLKAGQFIRSPELALLASEGHTDIETFRHPKIAILSTGDELRNIHESILPHQIRRSNPYAIQAALQSYAFSPCDLAHTNDNFQSLIQILSSMIPQYDVLIITGGVSKGKFDFVPAALKELGVQEIFHRVKQKPGKPLWFGSIGQTLVFGLPGNPASSLVCTYRYIIPTLFHQLGSQFKPLTVTLEHDIGNHLDLSFFKSVCMVKDKHSLSVRAVANNGSGDYYALTKSDGFIELAPKSSYKQGDRVEFYTWHSLDIN